MIRGGHSGLKTKYLKLENVWNSIENLKSLAEKINPYDKTYSHLYAAQLIRHILGLKKNHGKDKFRLLYLYYDTIGPGSKKHQDEIDEFKKITEKDGIKFHAMSYQELIKYLADNYRESHRDYIEYITSRYL